jgi:hypothetical protein
MALDEDFPPGSAAFMQLPPDYDPRYRDQNRVCGPVRKQPPGDQRCTAYATVTGMETWLLRAGAAPPARLSEDDLFSRSQGRDLEMAVKAAARGFRDTEGRAWHARFRRIDGPVNRRAELMCRYLVGGSPIVIAIPYFQNFTDGTDPFVPRGQVVDAHAVCIVGYHGHPSGPGYWVVQNSAGQGWGDAGCVRIKRGQRDLKPESTAFAVLEVARRNG